MGYENVLFNGKSMRNAIITKLSEDKHLTSALFSNSNITILIDILSYMYQCLMSNLRQAASESMWSDTIFFENANRLARLIGYYAKGQIPFTLLAKLSSEENINGITAPDFGRAQIGYGPYEYNFAVVEHNVNRDQSLVRLALGNWKKKVFTSDGTKFQEFIVERDIGDYEKPEFISQKYIRVFSKHNGVMYEWQYSADPLFLIQNNSFTRLDAEDPESSRTLESNVNSEGETCFFNFYIDENGNYVLKFGDGTSTAIPDNHSNIYVFYVTSSETENTITSSMKSAITNASAAVIGPQFTSDEDKKLIYDKSSLPKNDNQIDDEYEQDNLGCNWGTEGILCTPLSRLNGYREKDNPDSIRTNSRNAFSRQNRLVTKEDYRSFILENHPEFVDVEVQNNWEFISDFYGWLYRIQEENDAEEDLLTPNKLKDFESPDGADANNIYFWCLNREDVDINKADNLDEEHIGIMKDTATGVDDEKFGNSLGAIKDITIHPVFLYPLCKRFIPFINNEDTETANKINYDSPDPLEKCSSYFRIYVDSTYAKNLNVIKARTFSLIKSYLFDDIKLGKTPNVPALIKEIMAINGVVNITTVFNKTNPNAVENKNDPEPIKDEVEENGMKFCTWTDTNNALFQPSYDAKTAFNLPNIPIFQYFKSAQSYSDFIQKSIRFRIS